MKNNFFYLRNMFFFNIFEEPERKKRFLFWFISLCYNNQKNIAGVKILSSLTPMMRQFKEIKKNYPDAILFFRVGDFYEMFFEDAETASKELDIALTSRDGQKENAIPLAGVPYHAASNYIARLLEKGYKVAVCEQVEEASQAKGLVKREVTRVITPGIKIEESFLDEKKNNYLAALHRNEQSSSFGLTMIDVSTGEINVFCFEGNNAANKIFDEIYRWQPAEIILSESVFNDEKLHKYFKKELIYSLINKEEDFKNREEAFEILQNHFTGDTLKTTGILSCSPVAYSTALALKYIMKMYKGSIKHISEPKFVKPGERMLLDVVTLRNLEITETLRTRDKKNSLLGVLDRTKTAMGSRLLRKWLENPLLDSRMMERRWDAVEELKENLLLREKLGELLKNVYDLERLSSRISMGILSPRDLLVLKKTLFLLPKLKEILRESRSELLRELKEKIPDFTFLAQELEKAILDDPPYSAKEGNIFKEGYSPEVDELRKTARESRQWLLELEKKEKIRTGIKSLKVGYNKVFGYYIEVTKTNLGLVPDDYIRKQTLVNAERFITEELKEKETLIISAEEKLCRLEYELFENLCSYLAGFTRQLQETSKVLAALDCFFALAESASAYNYTKPRISTSGIIKIKGGRHPVVEQTQEEPFVPNDLFMDQEKARILIITGPNMAGKSTYCRSAALLLIMAQAGSFVPADEMEFTPVTHIFARVGASDDLSGGRSTFMVEMEETSSILANATEESLIILDEIGRGTSTFDGMSLAQSVLEYLHDEIKAKVLFSTHYHELTFLGEKLPGTANYTVMVKEKGEEVIFLRKVVPGKADKSYGINVARLAGLPEKVIERSQEILQSLEAANRTTGLQFTEKQDSKNKATIFSPSIRESCVGQLSILIHDQNFLDEKLSLSKKERKIIQEIKELNIAKMTPIEALNLIFSIQSRLLSR